MDSIILGLLMIKVSTIYEMRKAIEKILSISAAIVLEAYKPQYKSY